jgi:ABC-type branched-subunit amino acid transport system permease subunit
MSNLYANWLAFRNFKNGLGIHPGWDYVGYAFTIVIAMMFGGVLHFNGVIIGAILVVLEVAYGLKEEIKYGKILREQGEAALRRALGG